MIGWLVENLSIGRVRVQFRCQVSWPLPFLHTCLPRLQEPAVASAPVTMQVGTQQVRDGPEEWVSTFQKPPGPLSISRALCRRGLRSSSTAVGASCLREAWWSCLESRAETELSHLHCLRREGPGPARVNPDTSIPGSPGPCRLHYVSCRTVVRGGCGWCPLQSPLVWHAMAVSA